MAPVPPLPALDPAGTESVLRAIFADSTDAIGIVHRTTLRIVNPSMLRMFRFDREADLVGRSCLELVAPECRDALLAHVRPRPGGSTRPGTCRIRALRSDGSPFDVDLTTTAIEQGGQRFALALLREIGEANADARDLYEAIFERNTAIKLLIDPVDGRIVDANQAAAELYGWSVEVLRTKNIAEINLLGPDEVALALSSARLGHRSFFRFRHRVADGGVLRVDVHSGMVEVAGRSLLLSIVQDMTERDALEEQLRQSQKLEAIGRLAGGVAHDFNNLLTVMLSCGELLRREIPAEGRARRLLDDLMHAASRASDLTDQLLAVGQRQQLRPRPIRLDEVIERMQGLLARMLDPRMQVSLDLEPGLTVEVDPGQLEQIVVNLALNARDATDGQGRLEITARAVRAPAGLLVARAVALTVRDDGRGMDEATRGRVFEPFFTTKARGKGTGLGLASVWGIVTQSGGRVSVESRLGEGATFTVWLPLHEGELPPERPTPSGAVAGGCVLLVDDEAEIRAVLGEILERGGFRVFSVVSGDEALALSEEALGPIDVLVTDQTMPGVHGVDLARQLVARKPGLGVLLISGDVLGDEQSRLPEGATFLRKPFSGAELIRQIRALLDRGSPGARPGSSSS